MSFSTKNNVRIVTAASLFDGHDAAINISWPIGLEPIVSAKDANGNSLVIAEVFP